MDACEFCERPLPGAAKTRVIDGKVRKSCAAEVCVDKLLRLDPPIVDTEPTAEELSKPEEPSPGEGGESPGGDDGSEGDGEPLAEGTGDPQTEDEAPVTEPEESP
jgi:hypothetical protein